VSSRREEGKALCFPRLRSGVLFRLGKNNVKSGAPAHSLSGVAAGCKGLTAWSKADTNCRASLELRHYTSGEASSAECLRSAGGIERTRFARLF
jgi:hypothetical protein